MTLNWIQKSILGVGSLTLAFFLVWVPYAATLAREGDNFTRDIGYALVFDPPQQSGCESAFGDTPSRRLATACTVRVQTSRVLLAASAIGIATAALAGLIGLLGSESGRLMTRNVDEIKSASSPSPGSLAYQITSRSPKFPVSGGNCTDEDPLIITEKKDYIRIEYAVAEMLLKKANLDFDLALQELDLRGDRSIDILRFNVKPSGSTDWTHQRSFYFDITIGIKALRRRLWW